MAQSVERPADLAPADFVNFVQSKTVLHLAL